MPIKCQWQPFCTNINSQQAVIYSCSTLFPMTVKKSTSQKRAIKATKRKNAASPAGKTAPKKQYNADGDNIQEGYDEKVLNEKEKADAKRRKGD